MMKNEPSLELGNRRALNPVPAAIAHARHSRCLFPIAHFFAIWIFLRISKLLLLLSRESEVLDLRVALVGHGDRLQLGLVW